MYYRRVRWEHFMNAYVVLALITLAVLALAGCLWQMVECCIVLGAAWYMVSAVTSTCDAILRSRGIEPESTRSKTKNRN